MWVLSSADTRNYNAPAPKGLAPRKNYSGYGRREQGTGLGLAVVRRFVGDLGSSLELANLEPHGAHVSLILPRDPEHT